MVISTTQVGALRKRESCLLYSQLYPYSISQPSTSDLKKCLEWKKKGKDDGGIINKRIQISLEENQYTKFGYCEFYF